MAESVIKFGTASVSLAPCAIEPSWVLEGNPITRNKLLSKSADGNASSYIWDCTAGRFNWYYSADETIYVIEGGVVVKDNTGTKRRLSAGDTIFFPAGTSAEWHVEDYIRKFALIRTPMPWPLVLAKRTFKFCKRLIGAGKRPAGSPAMLPSG